MYRAGPWAALIGLALAPACNMDTESKLVTVSASSDLVDNPPLEKRCGIDVVLVLDASASVRNYNNPPDANGAVDLVANAARSFLTAFADTDSRVAVVSYNALPIVQIEFADVSSASIAPGGAHDVAIGDPGGAEGPIPVTTGYSEHARRGSGTNWDAGLLTALSIMEGARPGVPRLVVHVTDGRPTRHLDSEGNVVSEGGSSVHIAEAAEVADQIKLEGIHIYSVGIGRASNFVSALQAVAGPNVFDQEDPDHVFNASTTDVILASDFDELSQLLSGIANGLCSSSLTITKLASSQCEPDSYEPAGGWQFTAQPAATEGFDWVLPNTMPAESKTATSDAMGRVQFQWEILDDLAWGAGIVHITEHAQAGFSLQPEVTCTRSNRTVSGETFLVIADPASGTMSVPVEAGDAITCQVRNAAEPLHDGPLNNPPIAVATATQDMTCLAPGEQSLVTLDGSSSSDPDGNPITYRWYHDGALISTSVSPEVSVGPGMHIFTLVVNDGRLDSAPVSVLVTASEQPEAPPVIIPTPMLELWPPNHQYHTFTLADCVASVDSACAPSLDVNASGHIISMYSTEPENSTGDGNTLDDMVILNHHTFQVRAERRGNGNGRVYGVLFAVSDQAGNETTATCRIAVPHDRSGSMPADTGPTTGYMIHAP